MHSVHYIGRLTKILILILEGIIKKKKKKKKSYERRDYESVDEKILSQLSYVTKNNEKKTSCSDGLKKSEFFKFD